jgi:hypothetical protein
LSENDVQAAGGVLMGVVVVGFGFAAGVTALFFGADFRTKRVVALSFKSFGDFGHQAAKIAFDNFRLDATNVDCSSTRPDFHPDWTAGG